MPRITKALTAPIRELPDREKTIRVALHLSQREVERSGGLPAGWIARLEKGERLAGFSADYLVRLARGLGVTVSELLGEIVVLDEPQTSGLPRRIGKPVSEPKRLPGRIGTGKDVD